MTRLLFLSLLLTANLSYASWPLIHFAKCKITTADTTVTGYFTVPLEDQPDSVVQKFKLDETYFIRSVVNHLDAIELKSFIHVHYYRNPGDSAESHAIYRSPDLLRIERSEILKIEVLDIINFPFVPNRIITAIQEQDMEWLSRPVLKTYQDSDQCYPYRFLVYDDALDYESIIKELMIRSDEKEATMEALGKYKIMALILNLCD